METDDKLIVVQLWFIALVKSTWRRIALNYIISGSPDDARRTS